MDQMLDVHRHATLELINTNQPISQPTQYNLEVPIAIQDIWYINKIFLCKQSINNRLSIPTSTTIMIPQCVGRSKKLPGYNTVIHWDIL